ncbi:unnamed protein product [Symbiodinium sp. CCMP2592]|nr:unnamed protein product [Symbiodinium sp. CCMP2592]
MGGKRHAVLLTVVSSAIVMARPFDSRIWVHPFIPAPKPQKQVAVRGAHICSTDLGVAQDQLRAEVLPSPRGTAPADHVNAANWRETSSAPSKLPSLQSARLDFKMEFRVRLDVGSGPKDAVHPSMSKHPGLEDHVSPQNSTASGRESTAQASKDPGCEEDHTSKQTASVWAFCLCSSVSGGIAAWCVQRMFQRYQVDLAQFSQVDVFLIGTGLAFAAFGWLDDHGTSPDYPLHVIQQGLAAGAGGFYFIANQLRQRPRQV